MMSFRISRIMLIGILVFSSGIIFITTGVAQNSGLSQSFFSGIGSLKTPWINGSVSTLVREAKIKASLYNQDANQLLTLPEYNITWFSVDFSGKERNPQSNITILPIHRNNNETQDFAVKLTVQCSSQINFNLTLGITYVTGAITISNPLPGLVEYSEDNEGNFDELIFLALTGCIAFCILAIFSFWRKKNA